jgi:hypothetical protein
MLALRRPACRIKIEAESGVRIIEADINHDLQIQHRIRRARH